MEKDENAEEEYLFKSQHAATVILIDATTLMLKEYPVDPKTGEEMSAVKAAVQAAFELVSAKVISDPYDMYGVYLYGIEVPKIEAKQEDQENDSKSAIYPIMPLAQPGKDSLTKLKDFLEDHREAFTDAVSRQVDYKMQEVITSVQGQFRQHAGRIQARNLILVSNNDDPANGDAEVQQKTKTAFSDLAGHRVSIRPVFLNPPNGEFNTRKFYDLVVLSPTPSDSDEEPLRIEPVSYLLKMNKAVKAKSVPKRTEFSGMLVLDKRPKPDFQGLDSDLSPDGLAIAIKGYVTILKQIPSRAAWVKTDEEKPMAVVTSTQYIDPSNGATIDKGEIVPGYKFSEEDFIEFTKDDVTKMRSFGKPKFRILAFQPRATVPPLHNAGNARFIYPSDEKLVGSIKAYTALYEEMLKEKLVAIAYCIPRANAAPRHYCLYPCEEAVDNDGFQVLPPGLFMIPLVNKDELRSLPTGSMNRLSDDLYQVRDELAAQLEYVTLGLTMPNNYEPKRYPNPDLRRFNDYLQAFALGETYPPAVEDKTLPKYKSIDKRAGKTFQSFNELTHQYVTERGVFKFAHALDDGEEPAKQPKRSKHDDETKVKLEEGADREAALKKMTVPQLKQLLSGRGIATSNLKKADLIAKLLVEE
ncbi:hypothetical protein TRVA0_002S04940 [Trichomonascus vanleenenianus]|uniref:ATP-dependent DNA helicase YKU70 n=1 Tax=Trichomonascus vanleenenianus TaxID=2268995 RepID=UPI003EC96392